MRSLTNRQKRQKIMAFGFIVISLILSSCGDNPADSDTEQYTISDPFDYEIGVAQQQKLILSGVSGEIYIEGVNNLDAVKIWGIKTVKSRDHQLAVNHMDDLNITLYEDNDSIFVKTEQPSNILTPGVTYEVIYHVQMPPTWDLKAAEVNGEIEFLFMTNSIDINLANGQIKGSLGNSFEENCHISAINSIMIDMLVSKSCSAEFDASSANGTVTLSNLPLSNKYVSSNSVSGVLSDGKGSITIKTVNGNISVKGN